MRWEEGPQIAQLEPVPIPVKAVLRRLGYPSDSGRLEGQVHRLFDEQMASAPALLDPRGVYRYLHVASRTERMLTFANSDFYIKSAQVVRMLENAEPVILFMVTIGSRLEEVVKEMFDDDRMAEAVILDAIGSETADAVADHLHRDVLWRMARANGMKVTPRFSPGYGDWPVTVQAAFLKACGGDLIDISVNSSSLMSPRKSVSAVLGYIR